MTVLNGLSKLFVAGRDISGDVGAIQRIGGAPALLDISSLDAQGFKRIAGRFDGELSYNVWFDKLVSHAYLSTLPQADAPMMVGIPGTAAGDIVAMLVAKQAKYDLSISADLKAEFSVEAMASLGYPLEWGALITAGKRTDSTATASGAGIDLGIPAGVSATNITGSSTANPTVVTSAGHGLQTGDSVVIAGTNKSGLNTTWTVTVINSSTFSVPLDLTAGGASSGGTVQRTSHRGWAAQNQVFAIAGTSVVVTMQDCEASVGTYANLTGGAFTAVTSGAGLGAERIESASGIIRRFVRVKTTGTFSNATFATGIYTKEG